MGSVGVLFAHFDAEDRIRDHIVFHLKAWSDLGAKVVFITTSKPDEAQCDRIRPFVKTIVFQPENVGFDFYAWSSYLKGHREEVLALDWLILTNSSVLGPVFPLAPILKTMASHPIWGMTENFQPRHHLQSYFMAFRSDVLQTESFWTFFTTIIPFADAHSTISAYETTWTAYFEHQGWTPVSFSPPKLGYRTQSEIKILSFEPSAKDDSLLASWHFGLFRYGLRRVSIDPCYYYPDELLAVGMPFVKMKLFSNNTHGRNLGGLLDKIEQAGISVADCPALRGKI
ncbi:MAG: rhamnan synthesis F family protein [Candidatus Margulisiibacteriota bacterium]